MDWPAVAKLKINIGNTVDRIGPKARRADAQAPEIHNQSR
jgi:hypothetical protein